MSQPPDTRRIGRSRSEESKAAILEATWELLKTTCLRDWSIEAIAQQMASLVQPFSGEYGRIVAQMIAEGQACPEALAELLLV